MKNFKKLLSIILALLTVVSAVPVSAVYDMATEEFIDDIFRFDVGEFVQDIESVTDDPDVKRMEFLTTLGIWDDATKSKSALITMSEYATIMSRLRLGGQNAFVGVYEKNNDTSNVTYGVVLEGLLQTLGYHYQCKQYGDDEKSLLIVATEIGLISGDVQNINSFVNRNTFAKMIERALSIDLCVAEYTDYGISYVVSDGKTILSTVHNIHELSGFVNAIYGLNVYGGAGLRKGYFEIDRTEINAQGLDITQYLGTRVKAYAKTDEISKEYKLIYIAPDSDNEALTIDFKNITDITGNTIAYINEDGTEDEIRVDNYNYIIENGKDIGSLSQMCDFSENEGKIVFVASEKGGSFDTAVIYRYEYFVTDYIDTYEKRIGLKFGMKHQNDTYIPVNEMGINRIIIEGEETDYTSIKSNQAIRVFSCEDTNYLEIIVSEDKIVEGIISGMYEDILEVNNQKYRISKNLSKRISDSETSGEEEYTKIKMPEFGVNVRLFVYGDVITGYTANDGYMHAYLKGIKKARTSLDPELTLRLYTQNGEWLDAPFADKVTIDTVSGYSKSDISQWLNEQYDESNTNTDIIIDELVRVKLNGENKIFALDTVIETGIETDTYDDISHASDYEGGRVTARPGFHRWEIGQERYKFDKTAPVFVVPEDRSKEDKYRAVNPTALSNAVSYDMICYSPNEFLHLGAVIVIGDLEGTSASKGEPGIMYVENIRNIVIDAENFEYGYRVIGTNFVASSNPGVGACKEVSYTITKERYDKAVAEGNGFVVGDVIKLDNVSKNEIISWSFFAEIERSSSKITGTTWNVYDYGTLNGVENCKVYLGKVERVDVDNVLLLIDCGAGGKIVVKPRAKAIIDGNTKKATNIEIGDFHENDIVFAFGVGAHVNVVFKTVNIE